ncbi:hypothetical protein EXIGLDRAFT_633435 [Exidia glandulosa HHB12029]|uniref:Rad52/22 double-strand break repair protein n=1 Tax=Exidia glandulosa HHB12029 TaxID=1314781 RepID=A0A165Z222_EXIGL|nr:hypothetical protein EXIGLDRAFT_633435 [Exidia glandulosa HHB12029]
MHGSNSSFGGGNSLADASWDSPERIDRLQSLLSQRLGPEYVAQRPGPGGAGKLTYVEGWRLINIANEVFGFNGWSSQVISIQIDFCDQLDGNRFNVCASAIVRVTLRDGVFHEDVGTGSIDNARGKAAAFDKCKKEAVTDAMKRALRNFGNATGNCVYDKRYCAEVMKHKKEPVRNFHTSAMGRVLTLVVGASGRVVVSSTAERLRLCKCFWFQYLTTSSSSTTTRPPCQR